MRKDRILLCSAHMSGKEQGFIKEAFDQNWVVPLGPNVNGFEADLEQFVNNRNEAEPLDKQVVALRPYFDHALSRLLYGQHATVLLGLVVQPGRACKPEQSVTLRT